MTKIKTKLTFDAFRATQFVLPPIPTLRIVQINEGSPTQKPADLREEPSITPPPEYIISETVQQVITNLNKPRQDREKKTDSEPNSLVRKFKKSEGWS